jgi:hypothetical protein
MLRRASLNASQRQENRVSFTKRDQWTELQVKELPSGEHDYFERKSGRLFDNPAERNNLLDVLAKAASAFANSGGGHLVFGVDDNGGIDGVPRIFSGTTTTRDWLEQKLPDLLDYKLNDFRVHTVVPSEPSHTSGGRELIVIDIGDSALAPHQSRRHSAYYYRSAGRSVPAPHFYLELLRHRLTNAALEYHLSSIVIENAWKHADAVYLRFDALFEIKNVGRIAAYKWALVARTLHDLPDGRGDDFYFGGIPGSPGRGSGIRVDDTILPGVTLNETKTFGIRLRTQEEGPLREDITELFSRLSIGFQLATETSPGEVKQFGVADRIGVEDIIQFLRGKGLID